VNKVVRGLIEVSVAGLVAGLASACARDAGDAANAANASNTTNTASTANTAAQGVAKPIAIKVYKTPQCGCCKAWVDHLSENGFQVEAVDMPDLSIVKQKYGVTPALEACHTAVVDGYVVEGHVPADVIRKLLQERPRVVGIAVPGMPGGSPGMEGAMKQPYDVLTFDQAGRTQVFARR
jgi:hypothetical protein